MKKLMIILGLCLFKVGFGQKIERAYFENNPSLGGDVTILSASVKIDGEDISKTFELESLVEGAYYMDAWVLVPLIDGRYPEHKVAVNGVISENSLKPQSGDWHGLALTNAKRSTATVKLKKGINYVSLIGKAPFVPNVEFIKLSLNALDAGISDKNYREFVRKIETNTLYAENSPSIVRGTAGEIYDYQINKVFHYTIIIPFWWAKNQVVNISASMFPGTSGDFVIDLFRDSSPHTDSWVSFAINSGTLDTTIQNSDWYTLRIRGAQKDVPGEANVTVNGNSTYYKMKFSYNALDVTVPNQSGIKNYFTCKPKQNVNTRLFLEGQGNSGKVIAYNDDGGNYGVSPHNQNWGAASYISTSQKAYSASVSVYGSFNPSEVCDLYLNLPSTDTLYVRNDYPSFTDGNSFMSGSQYGGYNCHAWAVGVTNGILPDYPCSWDDFFLSHGYVPTSDEGNAAIALWIKNTTGTDLYHSSVRKHMRDTITYPNSVIFPHGFEWESKLGDNGPRVMHTKYAIGGNSGSGFGEILKYYKPINGMVNYSTPMDGNDSLLATRSHATQQTGLPLNVNNRAHFSESELNQIAELINLLPDFVKTDFEKKYQIWEETWYKPPLMFSSGFQQYAESEEYFDLMNYCAKFGKAVWPLLMDILVQKEHAFVVNLLRDLTYNGNNKDFVSHIRPPIESGLYQWELKSNAIYYCKRLLKNEYEHILKAIMNLYEQVPEAVEKNVVSFNNQEFLINLNVEKPETASVKIYSVFGILVHESTYNVPKGGISTVINASNFPKGVYVIQITVGSRFTSYKISV